MCANDCAEWIRREIDWFAVPLGRGEAAARHLPRRPDARPRSSARGCSATRTGAARSAISRSGRTPPATNFARSVSRAASISGTRTVSISPPAPNCSPPADRTSPTRPIDTAPSALALQFHPEVTYHMMCKWTLRGAERLTRPGAQQRPGHLDGWFQHDGRVAAWLEALLPAWLEGRLGEAPGERARARRGRSTLASFARGARGRRDARGGVGRLRSTRPRLHTER